MSDDTGSATLQATLAVSELRKAELAAITADTRPRTKPFAQELGEGLTLQRWTREQCLTIRTRLEHAGVTSAVVSANTDAMRGHCIKVIQIGTRRERALEFPGEKGFNAIGRLDNGTLARLASEALAFNEVFGKTEQPEEEEEL